MKVNGTAVKNYISCISVPLLLWPVGMVFMHFTLVEFAGFPITIGSVILLLIAALLFSQIKRVNRTSLFIGLLVVLYATMGGLFAEDVFEFVKSYAQLLLLVLFILLCIWIPLIKGEQLRPSISFLLVLGVAAALVVIAQFIFLNVLDSYQLMGLFGSFSPEGPGGEVYLPAEAALIKRPNGFFSEPSVAGWFLSYVAAIALLSREILVKNGLSVALICMLGAILTFSLSGILNVVIIVMAWLVLSPEIGVRKRIILTVLGSLVFSTMLWVLLPYGIANRIDTFFNEGTSLYYRLVAPIMLLSDSLVDFPLGHPLGQVNYLETKDYMENWDKGSNTNIDNSFFMLSYYFGIPGVIFVLLSWGFCAYYFLNRDIKALVFIAVFLPLTQSGALWSPNMMLIIGYTIIIFRVLSLSEHRYHSSSCRVRSPLFR